MNILMMDYEYPPLAGGGGLVHSWMAEDLAQRHRVVVITSALSGLPRREVVRGVEVLRVRVMGRRDREVASLSSLLSFPPAVWRAVASLRAERFDVMNGHFAVPTGPASVLTAKMLGIPHVLSLHGGDIFDPSKRLSPHRFAPVRAVVRGVLNHSDTVIAQSKDTHDNARHYYRYGGPLEIIPLGIPQPTVQQASRAELGLPEHAFLGVTVGRIIARKGIDQLIRILASRGVQTMGSS